MPPKKKTPAPIDRPVSRAYLREFTGWSSAYPPGISDPTSLRIMENVQINRDGSVRVRPGLRYISFEESDGELLGMTNTMVGTHEPFFLNDGTKAYLMAVREDDGTVGFRVLAVTPFGRVVKHLTDDGVDFEIKAGSQDRLAFSADTTYVKYIQVDNKIFALSNAGEPMRMFEVGTQKTARYIDTIERPEWTVADKLTVVHPDAAWVNAGTPTDVHANKITHPDMFDISGWKKSSTTQLSRSTEVAQEGLYSLRLRSLPERTNLMPHPLNNPTATGLGGWVKDGAASDLDVSSDDARISIGSNHKDDYGWARSDKMSVEAGERYRAAFDLEALAGIDTPTIRFIYYNTAGAVVGEPVNRVVSAATGDRKAPDAVKAPGGASKLRIFIGGKAVNNTDGTMRFRDVVVCKADESAGMFTGDSGANYFWGGDANDSASYYHPPQTVQAWIDVDGINANDWVGSIYARSSGTSRNGSVDIEWRKADNTLIDTLDGAATADNDSGWTRIFAGEDAPAKTVKARMKVRFPSVPRGESHYLDSAQFERGTTPSDYFDGNTAGTGTLEYDWTGPPHKSSSTRSTFALTHTLPAAETPAGNTLIGSGGGDNTYSFGFFYTFTNEVGESAASRVTMVRMQRAWGSWKWETPNVTGEPSGTATADATAAADQLVAFMPQPVYEEARDSGATHWNLYGFSWSDQDPVPVTAVLIDRRELASNDHSTYGWIQVTADMASAARDSAPVPTGATRYNYSKPSSAAQGIVAADRMIVVNDPQAGAVIKWTSNQQGNYTDFSAIRGGGYKTLTSGELFIPACVKLWQNPQSVDTLTILCMGVDGYSTGYYMAPAQVASQSEATNIMGFEETTATPGTVSPFGVEVMNNALYHPLDEQLMKSTANNYNIAHKSMTDQIADVWRGLLDKYLIVSSQHDNRLYYLVYNPDGEPLEEGCRGNEVWVFDTAAEKGNWSRWMVQGHSLRRIGQADKVFMSLIRPNGLYYFDEDYGLDDVVDPTTRQISSQSIPWRIETNTQGANRAHDAWSNLQQANVSLGFFQGQMRYGVRGLDVNGKWVDKSKIVRDHNEPSTSAFDIEDFLLVRRQLKEWFFYAESVTDEAGVVQPSYGQISLVQYRYTPISVNVGYEYGSPETFEYGRAGQPDDNRTTDNGVPKPYVDTRRP